MKYKKIIVVIVVITICFGITFFNIKKNEKVDIDEVLDSEYYSYLPDEAKDYVKQEYQNTGEVLLTEKNKEEGQPYLNPDYVRFLSLSQAAQEKEEIVPTPTIIDYVLEGDSSDSQIVDSSFDLRDVDGKNYLTPSKNQGGLGLCWAYATIEQAESLNLINKDKEYESINDTFSVRQVDYATAINGMNDYTSEYLMLDRTLGGGGHFYAAVMPLISGVGIVSGTWNNNDSLSSPNKELYEVLNYGNAKYEVNSTINMPTLDVKSLDYNNEEDMKKRTDYIEKVKGYIKKYGGAYVGTGAPGYGCSYYDSTLKKYVVDVDSKCSLGSHAMQIIGWDDAVQYKYCIGENGNHKPWTSSCTEENTIEGVGAWLLRNSWGSSSSYLYLAYDSEGSGINLVTDISPISDKTWDNSYVLANSWNFYSNRLYSKTLNQLETLKKIKFMTYSQNSTYTLTVTSYKDGQSVDEISKTIEVDDPGVITVDFSEFNLVGDEFRVYFTSNGRFLNQIFMFTESNDKDIIINTDDYVYTNNLNTDVTKGYQFRLYSETKNIPSNDTIDYKLFDENGNDLSTNISYEYNIVAENNVNTKMTVSSNIPKGIYTIKTYYKGEEISTSKLTIKVDLKSIEGSGTEESPYLITSADELLYMQLAPTSYFELANDIDLTEITSEDGILYNEGKGFQPITGFKGNLNGKGHSIIGLKINRLGERNVGLFSTLEATDNMSIENITFKNADIACGSYCGVLAGKVSDSEEVEFKINNINIIDSNINSNSSYIGGLFGELRLTYAKDTTISNIFSNSIISSTMSSRYNGGFIGNLYARNGITFNNLENIGRVKKGSSIVGYVYSSSNDTNINFNNVISTVSNSEVIYLFMYTRSNCNVVLNNVNYLENNKNISMYGNLTTSTNVKRLTMEELKNKDNYSTWDNFDSDYNIDKVDGISRFPILKSVNVDYTKIDDISLKVGEEINIYDYIKPNTILGHDVILNNLTEDLISITEDGKITGLNSGKASINIISKYDGYDNNIDIEVDNDTHYLVIFDGNGATGTMDYQDILVDIETELNTNTYTRNGYTFKEWNTKADGTGKSYQDKEEVLNIITGGRITLYAIWEANTYNIVYHGNGATGTMNSQEIKYDILTTLLTNVFKLDGYYFNGWNTKADGTGKYYDDESPIKNLITDGTIDLYAMWTKFLLKSNVYVVENKYIKNIQPNTKFSTYKTKFTGNSTYEMKLYNSSGNLLSLNATIYTGSITKIFVDGVEVSSYINIVKGDINGDGFAKMNDVMALCKYIIESRGVNSYYLLAADINVDSYIRMNDVMTICKYIIEGGTL